MGGAVLLETVFSYPGVGSLMVAAIWMGLFPALRKVDRFEPADDKKSA